MTKHICLCGFPRNEPDTRRKIAYTSWHLSSRESHAAISARAVTTTPAYRPGTRLDPWGHALAIARICCSGPHNSPAVMRLLQSRSIFLRHRFPYHHVEVSRGELLVSLRSNVFIYTTKMLELFILFRCDMILSYRWIIRVPASHGDSNFDEPFLFDVVEIIWNVLATITSKTIYNHGHQHRCAVFCSQSTDTSTALPAKSRTTSIDTILDNWL